MDKIERQKLIAELRVHHEDILPPGAYCCFKYPHLPENGDVKVIGLYPSEISKGDDVYVEMVTMDYKPLDASRRLYVWRYRSDFASIYKLNTKSGQFLVPVSDLSVVSSPQKVHNILTEEVVSVDTPPSSGLTFEKKETSERHYKEEVYEGKDGSIHKVEFKNGIPNEYQFMPKQNVANDPRGFVLQGEHIAIVFDFIKNLKY